MRMNAFPFILAAALSAHGAAAGTVTVLYDQVSTQAVGYATSQDFPPPMDAFDSAAADDFLVADPAGWAIDRFDFNAPPPGDATFGVLIYPDAGGMPGPSALCTYGGLAAGLHGTGILRVPLPSPCALPQGTYWVSFFGEPGTSLRWAAQFQIPEPPFFSGAPARWQNPGDGFGSGCTSWTNVQNCIASGDEDPITNFADAFQFRICGTVGADSGGGGGLCGDETASIGLAVTLAADDGNPDLCGSASSLDVVQGDRVNVCYVATNTSGATLEYQWLHDGSAGELFAHLAQTLPPGGSRQFNRVVAVDASQAFPATWTATDLLPGYLVYPREDAGTFVDVSGSGTALDLADDGSANLVLPFAFSFYGIATDRICVNNNGFVLLQTTEPCPGYPIDGSIPALFRFPAIIPFWDDLYTGGNVYHATLGSAPDRRFVVQWHQKNHYDEGASNPGGVSFELILEEGTGRIAFEYLDTTFDHPGHPEWDRGGSATVGLDYDRELTNHQGFHSPTLADDSAKDFIAGGLTRATAFATATVDVAAPSATVEPSSIDAASDGGEAVMREFEIGNAGSLDLHWDLGESRAPRAHFPAFPAFVVPHGDPAAADWRPLRRPKPGAARSAALPIPFGDPATTAYGLRFASIGWEYDRFDDIADPGSTTHVGTPHDLFYAADFIDDDFSRQYLINEGGSFATIDTANAVITYAYGSVQGSPEILYWLGMAWDASTRTLFAVGLDPFVTGSPHSFLARIDLSHGAASTTIGQFPLGVLMIDIAVDPSGHLYGLDIASDALVAIDGATAEVQVIGSIGFDANFAQDMDFDDATGILYLAGVDGDAEAGGLYTLDTQTGGATLIGPLREGDQYDGFAIASGAPCRPPQAVPWLSVEPTSGTAGPGASSAVQVTLDPAGLADGTHEANLCVFSDDALQPRIVVPVAFAVGSGGADRIFADGFDG